MDQRRGHATGSDEQQHQLRELPVHQLRQLPSGGDKPDGHGYNPAGMLEPTRITPTSMGLQLLRPVGRSHY